MGEGESLRDVFSALGEDDNFGGGGEVPLVDGVSRKVFLRKGYFIRTQEVCQLLLHGGTLAASSEGSQSRIVEDRPIG